mgnify:CR=1 FL=1
MGTLIVGQASTIILERASGDNLEAYLLKKALDLNTEKDEDDKTDVEIDANIMQQIHNIHINGFSSGSSSTFHPSSSGLTSVSSPIQTGETTVTMSTTVDLDAVFYRTYPLLYHKFGNIVIFRSGKLILTL